MGLDYSAKRDPHPAGVGGKRGRCHSHHAMRKKRGIQKSCLSAGLGRLRLLKRRVACPPLNHRLLHESLGRTWHEGLKKCKKYVLSFGFGGPAPATARLREIGKMVKKWADEHAPMRGGWAAGWPRAWA